jgi:hypothetical protein
MHGVGCGRPLGIVDHRLGMETLKNREQERIITDIVHVHLDGKAADGLPQFSPLVQIGHLIKRRRK